MPWEELLPSPKGGRAVTWGEEVAGEVLASPGGRALASLGGRAVARDALASPGRVVFAWEGIVPSLEVTALA